MPLLDEIGEIFDSMSDPFEAPPTRLETDWPVVIDLNLDDDWR